MVIKERLVMKDKILSLNVVAAVFSNAHNMVPSRENQARLIILLCMIRVHCVNSR